MLSLSFLVLYAVVGLVALQGAIAEPPSGFVQSKDGQFVLDGKPFYFVGANSYWLPLLTTREDVDATLQEMQGAGVKVLRTWGFNMINDAEVSGALQSNLTYYQVWNSSDWILNDGPQGLERLDYVIEAAGNYGIKVLVALTNNWFAYGGTDLYISRIAGATSNTHDVFFSNPAIVESYQRYAKVIVERYKDSPNVFGWELINEARCLSETLQSGPKCAPASGTPLLTQWYKARSAYIRTLDPNHMIATGGEGHFFWQGESAGYYNNGTFVSDYNFNGQAGEDFDGDLALENIDFGTYHLYPQSWYSSLDHPGTNWTAKNWGLKWIQAHADAAAKAGKPVIIEEFGVSGLQNKTDIYPEWVDLALKTKHAGILPWQFGMSGLSESGGNRVLKYLDVIRNGASPDDGLAIYKNQTDLWSIFTNAARVQDGRSE